MPSFSLQPLSRSFLGVEQPAIYAHELCDALREGREWGENSSWFINKMVRHDLVPNRDWLPFDEEDPKNPPIITVSTARAILGEYVKDEKLWPIQNALVAIERETRCSTFGSGRGK